MAGKLFNFKDSKINSDLVGIKKMLCNIILVALKDLNKYVEDPHRYGKYLISLGDSPKHIINFWKNDAIYILSFLVGNTKAKIFLEKISSIVFKAETLWETSHKAYSNSKSQTKEGLIEHTKEV